MWILISLFFGFAATIDNLWALEGLHWLLTQVNLTEATISSTAVTLFLYSVLFSGFMFFPYMAVFVAWYKRLGGFSLSERAWDINLKIDIWLYLKTFLTNRSTLKGAFFFALACIFGSVAIAVTSIPSPNYYQMHVVGLAQNPSIVPPANANLFVGLADLLFWPMVVMLIAVGTYCWLVRPRFVKFVTFSALLPVLTYLTFLIPAVQASENRAAVYVFLIVISVWIIPFMGLLHAGYSLIVLGGGHARKAVVKSQLADRPTLLLLRCFALDNTLIKRSPHVFGAIDILRLFLIRLEEVIVGEAFLQAPVIAVANPQVEQEPLGAVREYLSNEDWQPFVSDKIVSSQAIVFILGRGNYTGWETQQIIENDAVDRVIFIVPPNPQPALDYLDQNPQIRELVGGDRAVQLIGSRKVRGFVTGESGVVIVMNRFASELSYRLAMRRLLVAATKSR